MLTRRGRMLATTTVPRREKTAKNRPMTTAKGVLEIAKHDFRTRGPRDEITGWEYGG